MPKVVSFPHNDVSISDGLYTCILCHLVLYYSIITYLDYRDDGWCSFGSKERKTMQLVDVLRESPTPTDEDVIYGVLQALLVSPERLRF